jgi:hypothetical protein
MCNIYKHAPAYVNAIAGFVFNLWCLVAESRQGITVLSMYLALRDARSEVYGFSIGIPRLTLPSPAQGQIDVHSLSRLGSYSSRGRRPPSGTCDDAGQMVHTQGVNIHTYLTRKYTPTQHVLLGTGNQSIVSLPQ